MWINQLLICFISSLRNNMVTKGYLVIWSGRGWQGAQGVFAAGMAGSSWHWMAWGGSLPLCGARWNVPVINTSHVCHHLPSWRQIRVCLKWLLPPDICKHKYTRSGVVHTPVNQDIQDSYERVLWPKPCMMALLKTLIKMNWTDSLFPSKYLYTI